MAKYMNEYAFKDVGAMKLLFQEEELGGVMKGFPYVIDIADHNSKLHAAQVSPIPSHHNSRVLHGGFLTRGSSPRLPGAGVGQFWGRSGARSPRAR